MKDAAHTTYTPRGYRRDDPDETLGRWLYRQRAEQEVRRSMSMARKVTWKDD